MIFQRPMTHNPCPMDIRAIPLSAVPAHSTYQAWNDRCIHARSIHMKSLTPPLSRLGVGLSSSVFFAVRQPVKDAVVTSEMVLGLPVTAQWLDPVHNFISGAILGATLSTMFYPLNVIKVCDAPFRRVYNLLYPFVVTNVWQMVCVLVHGLIEQLSIL